MKATKRQRATTEPGEEAKGSPSEQLLFGGPLVYAAKWANYRNAYFEMSLWAMALRLPRLVAFTTRLAWRADRRALWTTGVGTLARGISQAISLITVNAILAAVLATGEIGHRVQSAIPAMIGAAATGILGALANAAATSGSGRLEPKVERVATEMYLTHVIKVELAAVEDAAFQRLMDSAQYGAQASRRMVSACTGVVGSLISFVSAAGVLTVLHPALLPLLLLMTVPRSWASLQNSRAKYSSYLRWMEHSRAGRLLSQTLVRTGPAPEIRVHGVGPFILEHFRQMSQASETEQARLAADAARVRLIAAALTGLAALLTYAALAGLLVTGVMALSVAGTAVLAVRTGGQSLSTLVLQVNNLYEEACYVQDLERLFVDAEKWAIPKGGRPVPRGLSLIRFDNVTFTYPTDNDDEPEQGPEGAAEDEPEVERPALKGVSLDIPVGKIIALVGENGSGKTTVSKLLAGLYQPDSGRILWDGVPAGELDRAQLFAQFAVVGQDFHRWPFTCRMNVAIGRPDRPTDQSALERAAVYAGADSVVDELPRGWDTLLNKGYRGGHQISGGQWQKLGIARARYRDAEILIVDEPTSALDAKAEQDVFEQIHRLADTGQTVVLITHRLASVRYADLIHVLDKGELRESGTFEELLSPKAAGVFRELYEMQARQYQDAPVPGPRRPADVEEGSNAQ
ncbi:ABC transporter ATP-binding protein [Streptomyces sp. NPDC001407]|uniref:ABC transporter ATP-binding protein n=1 Tax=unclassified Streptomyces TaxID=2593676 RepID=UPI00369E1BDB